jgi:F-type H+-transporting ATPase subunit delta
MNAVTQLQRPAGTVETERAATVYAEALLNVAAEENQSEPVLRDLQTLVTEVLQKQPEVAEFFSSAIVGRDRKATVLQQAFGPDKIHPVLSRFLEVLNDHDRLGLLPAILVMAQRVHLRRTNKILVDVVSAVPLTEAEQERVKAVIHGITNADPIPMFRLDPALVGGLVIRAGSWLFDGSVRGRLQAMRESLFERQPLS